MPNRPVRDQWEYPREINGILRLNRVRQWEWLLPLFTPFPNSLIRAKNWFVKNGTANFGGKNSTEISGPPPEVIPNVSVGRNRYRLPSPVKTCNFSDLIAEYTPGVACSQAKWTQISFELPKCTISLQCTVKNLDCLEGLSATSKEILMLPPLAPGRR